MNAAKKLRDDIAARFCYASNMFDSKREIACNMEHPIVRRSYEAADALLSSYNVSLKTAQGEPK